MSSQANGNDCSIPCYQEDMRKMTGPPGLLFPAILYKILKESPKFGHEQIISWLPNGRAFKIHDHDEFVEKVLPKYYPSSSASSSSLLSPAFDDLVVEETTTSIIGGSPNDNRKETTTSSSSTIATNTTTKQQQFKWKSFLRQINLYGFERITKKSRRGNKKSIDKSEIGAYTHEFFRRDDESLCCLIQRKDGKSKRRFPQLPQLSPVAPVTVAAKMLHVMVSSTKKNDDYKNNIIVNDSRVTMKSFGDTVVTNGSIRENKEVSGNEEETKFSTRMTKQERTKGRFDSYDHHGKETDCTDSCSPADSSFLVTIEIAEEGGQRRGTEKAFDHSVGCGNQLSSTTGATSLPSSPPSFCPSQKTSSHHSIHKEEPPSSWELSHYEHNNDPDGFDFWNTEEEDKLNESHYQMDYFSERDIVSTTTTPTTTTVGTFSNTTLDTTSSVNKSNMILPFNNEGASTTNAIVPTIFPFACTTHPAVVSPTFYNQNINDGICFGSKTGLLGSSRQDPIATTTNTNTIWDDTTDHQFLSPCHQRTTLCTTTDDSIHGNVGNNTVLTSYNGGEQHKTMEEMLIENESLLSVLLPGIRVSSPASVDTKQMYPFTCSPKQMLQASTDNHQGIREEDKVLYSLPPSTSQAEFRSPSSLPSMSYNWEDSTKFKSSASSAMEGLEECDFGWDDTNHGSERTNFIQETIEMLADILEPDPI